MHCNWHTQKRIYANYQAFSNTFSLFKLIFFSFFVRESLANSQKLCILLILTKKNALKWPKGCILKVGSVPNPMAQVSSLYNKWFLKNHYSRQKFHILFFLTGKNASKWLEWYVFRVQGMLNLMALVSSLYYIWFLKNQDFRRQVA